METYSYSLEANSEHYFYSSSSLIHGTGLFTAVTIPSHSILLAANDPQLLKINHSCFPNVAFNAQDELTAIRAIDEAEELLLDYNQMTMGGDIFRCNCGYERCRQNITSVVYHIKR